MMDTRSARDLLAFYAEAGIDTCVGEMPVDHFAEPADIAVAAPALQRQERPAQQPALPPVSRVVPTAAPAPAALPGMTSADEAVMAAREAAASAATLEDLRAILDGFHGCALRTTAKQLVFADGNPAASLMIVGEAPGYEEDIEGRPFVGRSGQLLDRMLAAIGRDRTNVYIANIVPWRPPGNRTPTPHESAICLPFIQRQIALANPDVLVCLGNPSAQALLAIRGGITKSRGRWMTYDTGSREIRAMAMFHPAFLLRSPLQKRFAWRDLLAVKTALAASS